MAYLAGQSGQNAKCPVLSGMTLEPDGQDIPLKGVRSVRLSGHSDTTHLNVTIRANMKKEPKMGEANRKTIEAPA